ncbi:MAG: hypothetical protein M1275_01765 [Patescibacteria group bacterium]|nr:hypothetical protein [Patescibacteria group bacterium]
MKYSSTKAEIVLRAAALILGLLFARNLFAQTWVEERTFVSPGQTTVRINGLVTGGVIKKFGGFVWFQTQKGYSEAYGGATYSPKPWLRLALGAGVEEAKNPARAGGFVWMGNSKQYLLFIPEYGGSGFWWKLEGSRKINKTVGVGFLTERLKGSGPRVEYAIPHTPLKVWAAPMFERKRMNALIGIRWTL